MNIPDLESLKKHVKSEYKDLSEPQIELKAREILESYLKKNKEKIDKRIQEDKNNLEISLDKEFNNLLMDWKSDD